MKSIPLLNYTRNPKGKNVNRGNIRMSVLIVILLLFSLSWTPQASSTAEEKQIIVVFRFDDYSSRSATDMEVKLIEAFHKHNIPCTFGVIPYACAGDYHDTRSQGVIPLTPMKANILNNAIKAGILEVALHGYSHQTIREGADGGYTEFSGLDYIEQEKKIVKGKNLLEEMLDIQVTTFIPPWGSYDLNTIRALEKLGFNAISAGTHGVAKESSPLKFLPATCGILQLREAVESARCIPEVQPIIVVLFHAYDFLEINREQGNLTYQEFVELLDWIKSQKDIHVSSINQITKEISDLSARRFMKNHNFNLLSLLIPPFLSKLCRVPVGVYLSSNTINNMRIKLWTIVSLFYLSTLLISIAITFYGGFIVFPGSRFMTSISKYGSPVLLFVLSIYALRNLVLTYRGAMVIAVLLGACAGIWSSFLKLRKQGRLK